MRGGGRLTRRKSSTLGRDQVFSCTEPASAACVAQSPIERNNIGLPWLSDRADTGKDANDSLVPAVHTGIRSSYVEGIDPFLCQLDWSLYRLTMRLSPHHEKLSEMVEKLAWRSLTMALRRLRSQNKQTARPPLAGEEKHCLNPQTDAQKELT